MRAYLVLCVVLAAMAAVLGQTPTNSSVKSIDFSSLKKSTKVLSVEPSSGSQDHPQQQDVQQQEQQQMPIVTSAPRTVKPDTRVTNSGVKYIDYSSLKKSTKVLSVKQASSGSQDNPQQQQQQEQQQMPSVTSAPRTMRPDPRATEAPTPEPTLPPTLAPTPEPTPVPPPAPTVPFELKTIGHDEIKPFPQPMPVTVSEKAGVKFKPQIQIRTGCEPYPVVNELGQTGGGLQTSGSPRGGCRGSGYGSQVYGRSTWHNGIWVIMYSWYFPKDSASSKMGHRHDWEHVVLFIDNPEVPEPKILACSVSSHNGYYKYNPCPPETIDGTSLKVRYRHAWPLNHDLDTTGDPGTFQDLIMWNQMTDYARRGLNETKFGKANTPMNDWNFVPKIERSWPFK